MGLGKIGIIARKDKRVGLWFAETRNSLGGLIRRSAKTKSQAIKLARTERNFQNKLIKQREK